MAEYPTLAATLPALQVTMTDPSDVEAANKLAAVDRQTRTWLYAFLSTIVDPTTGKLRDTAIGTATIPTGTVRGSESNDPAALQREILQDTVSTKDLRDAAVSNDKIAVGAVENDNIADLAITGTKIADGAIDGSKLTDNSVDSLKLADGAVTPTKIADSAVTTDAIADAAITADKIGANQVTGDKLPLGASAQVLLHNGTTYVPTTLTGAISVTPAGVVTLIATTASVTHATIVERVASGGAAGASIAASWAQTRGVATAWTIEVQEGATAVALGAAGLINFVANGAYWIRVQAPAVGVGGHKIRVTFTPVTGPAVDHYGTSECATAANTCSVSFANFIIGVSGASSGTPATLKVLHWTQNAVAVSGLGAAVGSGDVERYAVVEIVRLG